MDHSTYELPKFLLDHLRNKWLSMKTLSTLSTCSTCDAKSSYRSRYHLKYQHEICYDPKGDIYVVQCTFNKGPPNRMLSCVMCENIYIERLIWSLGYLEEVLISLKSYCVTLYMIYFRSILHILSYVLYFTMLLKVLVHNKVG